MAGRMFDGTVEIDVSLTGGSSGVMAFALPAGYRPRSSFYLPAIGVWTDGSDAIAHVDASTGYVTITWQSGAANSYQIHHRFQVPD